MWHDPWVLQSQCRRDDAACSRAARGSGTSRSWYISVLCLPLHQTQKKSTPTSVCPPPVVSPLRNFWFPCMRTLSGPPCLSRPFLQPHTLAQGASSPIKRLPSRLRRKRFLELRRLRTTSGGSYLSLQATKFGYGAGAAAAPFSLLAPKESSRRRAQRMVGRLFYSRLRWLRN